MSAAQPMPPAPPAPRRGTHPLVWVLVVILGLFGLGIVGVVGTGVWIARNPARAVRRLLATNPNLDVISTDDGAGTITIRDRRNGKVVTMSFDQARRGKFNFTADDGEGRTAEFQLGGEVKPPSWLPAYPGAEPHGIFSARGDSGVDGGDAGSFSFTTPDPGSQVLSFYEDKARSQDMTIRVSTRTGNSGSLAAADEEHDRGFKVIVVQSRHQTRVTVTYGRKI